ncbi:MAG: LysR family transcriptional regulator [Acidobacteriaceae bacterium]|nr:LysR family transcriptional regulator [Acidobacteriaceae bacterium]
MPTIDQLDILDLQCVVVLAETLNFTETARRLNMTQPGVTTRLNKVERNREYKLFDRTKGLMRAVTPTGFIFIEEAKQILEQLHRMITRSDAAHRAFSETLSISRSHHADLKLLSTVIAAQELEAIHILIQLPCSSDEEAISKLIGGEADAALTAWPITHSQIAAIHLTHDSLVVVLPENHVLHDRAEIHMADLRNERIIGSKYQYPATLKETLVAKCKALGFTPEWLCITASPAESVHLVDSGVSPGITILTKQYAKEISPMKAICVPFADGELAYEYGVAYRQTDHRPSLHTFLRYLKERCQLTQGHREKRKPARSG